MLTYITLFNLTDQEIKYNKNEPGHIEDIIKGAEAMGGKVLGVYSTKGEYNYVTIGEFPSDGAQLTFAVAHGSRGHVRSTTLKAFTKEEFAKVVEKVPKPIGQGEIVLMRKSL